MCARGHRVPRTTSGRNAVRRMRTLTRCNDRRLSYIARGTRFEVNDERERSVCEGTMSDTFRQDLRSALRVLFRSRGFALAAVIMLAIGIGANTAIFSVLRASSLRGSPLPDPDRLGVIWTTPPGNPQATEGARIVEYFAWRDQNRTFDAVGTMLGWSSTVNSERDGEPAERLSGARFSASLFRALAVQPQLGRFFTPDEDTVGFGDGVVVISDRL